MQLDHSHDFLEQDEIIHRNQRKTQYVVVLTSCMTIGEIVAGYFTGSMALIADGWHMASHAGALLIALLAYKLARSPNLSKKLSFGAGKLIPLGGFTSAIILAMVALLIVIDSVTRLFSPVEIQFREAICIACLGLAVNVLSALILNHETHHHHRHHDDDHDHDEEYTHIHDHNIRSAFLHVLADAVVSILAIGALLLGMSYHLNWLDPVIGVVGAVVIVSWAYQLCRDTGWELLDGHSKTVNWSKLQKSVEIEGTRILDFHVWRIAPQAIACELVVKTPAPRGHEYYRNLLREKFSIQHMIVEERPENEQ